MTSEEQTGPRSTLEWVSCPECSTTFRVAIPSQFEEFVIHHHLPEDAEDVSDYWQTARCPNKDCRAWFHLELYLDEEEEEEW